MSSVPSSKNEMPLSQKETGTRLRKWALTADIVGGLAIVVSMIFVGYEMRQSTKEAALNRKALEIATYQSLIESISTLGEPIIRDAEFAAIWIKLGNGEPLRDDESIRIGRHYGDVFRHGDLAFYQYQNGVINEERLRSALGLVVGTIYSSPFARDNWESNKQRRFTKPYADYIDALLYERKQLINPAGTSQVTP